MIIQLCIPYFEFRFISVDTKDAESQDSREQGERSRGY